MAGPTPLRRPRPVMRRDAAPARIVSGPAGALEVKRRPPGLGARQARHPDHLAAKYRTILLRRVRLTRDLLLAQLDRVLDGSAGREMNAAVRADDALTDLIRVVELVQRAVDETLPINEGEIQGVAEAVDTFATAQQAEVFARVAAIDIFTPELATGLYRDFITANVDLITSIDARFFADIQTAVTDAVRTGRSTAELRKEVQARYSVSRSRAELIARDQIGKFNGQVTEYRQRSVGIAKYMWSTSGDERVRESHKELDGKIFEWSKPPAEGHPGEDFQCLPGDMGLTFAEFPAVAWRRRYSGELTEIVTASGEVLRATPNHPVLTLTGWKAAQLVQVGDHLIREREEGLDLPELDVEHREPSMEEVFDALALVGLLRRVSGVASQFHGDGTADEEIDVVDIDWGLPVDFVAACSQEVCEFLLAKADAAAPRCRQLELVFTRHGLPPDGRVRGFCKLLAALRGGASHPGEHPLGSIAWLDTVAEKARRDGQPLDLVPLRDRLHALASIEGGDHLIGREWLRVVCRAMGSLVGGAASAEVLCDQVRGSAESGGNLPKRGAFSRHAVRVVEVRRGVDRGTSHVFNLQTAVGWFSAGGLITHNCRCVAVPVLDDADAAQLQAEQAARVEREKAAGQY